jgi:hypothetical protein
MRSIDSSTLRFDRFGSTGMRKVEPILWETAGLGSRSSANELPVFHYQQ